MKTAAAIAILCLAFGVSEAQAQSVGTKEPGKPAPGEMFRKMDLDGDGRISKDEAAKSERKRLQENFDRIDTNKDGYLDKEELKAFRELMKQQREGK